MKYKSKKKNNIFFFAFFRAMFAMNFLNLSKTKSKTDTNITKRKRQDSPIFFHPHVFNDGGMTPRQTLVQI